MRQAISRFVLLIALASIVGCVGAGNTVWVTGVLQKNGEIYKPPEGHKLAIYFCPISEPSSPTPNGDLEMADYSEKDGTFTVPGVEGLGIPPQLYRIALVETLRAEAVDQLKKATKQKRGQKRIDDDQNLLEAAFGTRTSPFVRDVKSSEKIILDMAKPKD